MNVDQMPSINAALNGLASVFLLLGYFFIKKDNKAAHKNSMIAAFVTSAVFLACYLWYHYNSAAHTALSHPSAAVNTLYFILITHIILAIVILPDFYHSESRIARTLDHTEKLPNGPPMDVCICHRRHCVPVSLCFVSRTHRKKLKIKPDAAPTEENAAGE